MEKSMINSKKTLLAYLDILGYKEIIENEPPGKFYKSIVAVFDDLKQLFDGLVPHEISSDSDLEKQCNAEIVKAIKFNIISDAIIVSLRYDDINRINQDFYEKIDNDFSGLVLFFYIVSTFVLRFVAQVGFLLRGGICLGEFYHDVFNHSLLTGDFVFSKTLVGAYLLEQEAKHPRILVDKSLSELWKTKVEEVSKQYLLTKALVVQDMDGEFYIDFYEIMRTNSVEMKKVWLDDIVKKVATMLIEKSDNKNVWKKWYWFKEYHNQKITTFAKEENQDLNDFLIR
ncbi:MAG: hypothetical protein JW715_08325 [Sedimentisphaerales bacterium]|nr:hypothetical protein [Sedimentisphaerales bacterium]